MRSGKGRGVRGTLGRWALRAARKNTRHHGALSESGEKVLTTGATLSAVLLSLTGGLALVVRSLKNTDLSLSLSLTRSPQADPEAAETQAGHAGGRTRGGMEMRR